jgi:hypothetical protein
VTLTGLKPGTTYYYKITSTNSSVEHFFSPRVPGDKTPFSIVATPDLGVYGADGFTIKGDQTKRDMIPQIDPSLNHSTIDRLAQTVNDYEFVLHPGDLAYADDWFEKPKNLLDGKNAFEAILEQFYAQLAPIAGRKPYMVSPGNHEVACDVSNFYIHKLCAVAWREIAARVVVELFQTAAANRFYLQEIPVLNLACPEGQKNFTDFMNRFGATMPSTFASTSASQTAKVNANKAAALANPPFWYSFEYGMVHIVMIDTETDFKDAPDRKFASMRLITIIVLTYM